MTPSTAARLLLLPTLEIAAALLGWRLVRDDPDDPDHNAGRRVGRIVELEAYIGEADQASHARFGRTPRNAVMYGPAGRAYVYLVYGMHDCLNIVTEPAGSPAALLVRAVEPLEGVARMRLARTRRATDRRRADVAPARVDRSVSRPAVADHRLAAGPGLVCAAFDLDRELTGHDLFDPTAPVRIEPPLASDPRPVVVSGPRVGIAYAGAPWTEVPWRFAIAGNPAVSMPPIEAGTGRPRG
jgi:DNA-3-methyladenine glycosylase